uniref:25S rRNA (uridine-N(3))-methyltransferase BMT5-like domain-containing protein n=1 Tax=Fagus sylvatica TaxID=28930 RepID=A0A2N9FVU1_FAGSY
MDREVEIWKKHYSSKHRILLVGEGDFSFSLCLARAFGSAHNMVATSLDTQEDIARKYKKGIGNVRKLEERGCFVLHEVDAKQMSQHFFLRTQRFDRIVYNFPHVGFLFSENSSRQIQPHRTARASRILAWSISKLEEAKQAIRLFTGIDVAVFTADVRDYDVVSKAINEAEPIDVLIVNQGVFVPQELEKQGLDEIRFMMDVNLMGTFHMIKAALPSIKKWSHRGLRCAGVGDLAGCGVACQGGGGFFVHFGGVGLNKRLVKSFLKHAKVLLRKEGEIHVAHKEGEPYSKWDLVGLAEEIGLVLHDVVPFYKDEYPARKFLSRLKFFWGFLLPAWWFGGGLGLPAWSFGFSVEVDSVVAWRSGLLAWRSGLVAWRSGLVAWRSGLVALRSGLVAWRSGLVALRSGLVAWRSGLVAWRSGLVAWRWAGGG